MDRIEPGLVSIRPFLHAVAPTKSDLRMDFHEKKLAAPPRIRPQSPLPNCKREKKRRVKPRSINIYGQRRARVYFSRIHSSYAQRMHKCVCDLSRRQPRDSRSLLHVSISCAVSRLLWDARICGAFSSFSFSISLFFYRVARVLFSVPPRCAAWVCAKKLTLIPRGHWPGPEEARSSIGPSSYNFCIRASERSSCWSEAIRPEPRIRRSFPQHTLHRRPWRGIDRQFPSLGHLPLY